MDDNGPMTPAPRHLQTLRDHIRWAVSSFHRQQLYFGHGTDNAWDEARQLVLGALQLPWETPESYLDCRLEEDERQHLAQLLARRIQDRVPLPYLLNEAWFCGLPFYVDERVLIPRSPIGELIKNRFHGWLPSPPGRILDLCTGSGCIGIAAAQSFPEAEVVLADISSGAIEVANINIERYELEDRVYCVLGDGFDGLPGQRFDLILCNPPYVDADDFASMPDEYRHEPSVALASGVDGLDLTRRLLAQAADHLQDRGIFILEVGNSQQALQEQYPQVGFDWLEFADGGHGVLLLTAAQCRKYQGYFAERLGA